jgi:hypothetical protein
MYIVYPALQALLLFRKPSRQRFLYNDDCDCLFLILRRLHVSLLDILPLALYTVLVPQTSRPSLAHTPLLMASHILSDPVSKALCPQSVFSPHLFRAEPGVTHSCRPKAETKTVPSMVVLLRMKTLVGGQSRSLEAILVRDLLVDAGCELSADVLVGPRWSTSRPN